jgi:alpha-glucoside transport system substrate-binding protein
MAKRGFLTDLGAENASWLKDNYAAGQSWVDLGTYAGKDGNKAFYGFPFKTDLKSLVWYSPENFEDAGYEVPKTMEELKALTEKIVADGGTPWCIGLGSGAATGWPATDWVEDMMLRTASPEDYDKWVSNEMKFDDPVVVNAINEFGWFAKNDKFVVGGAGAVASTDFRDSPKGLFASPPQCYMHRQASFIPSFFPEGTSVGEDADFFYFPAYAEKNLGSPVLGAGTTFTITKDSKAARAFIEFLKSPIAHEVWMAQKGFLTPHKGVNPEVFTDPTVRKMNDILLQATTFRFDGSDLMPGAVGAGSFWTGMVDYVGGKSAEDVAKSIQASWDGIK